MTILAIFNQKGGVGKTTTALNLAAALACSGRMPVGIDLDPQAHFSAMANVIVDSGDDSVLSVFQRNRPLRELVRVSAGGIHVIPSHRELSKVDALFGNHVNIVNRLSISLRGAGFDCKQRTVLIDCCPLLGVLSLNAIFACDCLIVPIASDHLSCNSAIQFEKTLATLEPVLKRRIKRRYLLTRFDGRRKMAREVQEVLEAKFGAEVCRTRIAESSSLTDSLLGNPSVFDHAPHSCGARDYSALRDELMADGLIE